MRTTIVIDDQLIAEAIEATRLPTKMAGVEACWRLLIQVRAQTGVLWLRGPVDWQGEGDELRAHRLKG